MREFYRKKCELCEGTIEDNAGKTLAAALCSSSSSSPKSISSASSGDFADVAAACAGGDGDGDYEGKCQRGTKLNACDRYMADTLSSDSSSHFKKQIHELSVA